jgi:hypothetical protein
MEKPNHNKSSRREHAMYIKNYPEDSVLRRHFESAAALKSQAWLQHPPSDSVLRRHYEQQKNPWQSTRVNKPASQPRPGVSSAAVDQAASAPVEQASEGNPF